MQCCTVFLAVCIVTCVKKPCDSETEGHLGFMDMTQSTHYNPSLVIAAAAERNPAVSGIISGKKLLTASNRAERKAGVS